MVKNCVKSWLEVLNASIGIGGIAIIIYGVLMIRAWQPYEEESSSSSFPWFIHAFLGVGIIMCSITCIGHIAAKTANFHCLSCYITVIMMLLILETAIAAYVFLNSHWEKDLPNGRLKDFEHFVESSDDICKGAASLIFVVQGGCILLASILRTRAEKDVLENYESEDEDFLPREPLLGQSVQSPLDASNVV